MSMCRRGLALRIDSVADGPGRGLREAQVGAPNQREPGAQILLVTAGLKPFPSQNWQLSLCASDRRCGTTVIVRRKRS